MITLTYWQLLGLIFASGLAAAVMGFYGGLHSFTYFLHYRAARSNGIAEDGRLFDASNVSNTTTMVAHFGTHWEDFYLMTYPNGKRCFPYLTKDLSETVMVRPDPEDRVKR